MQGLDQAISKAFRKWVERNHAVNPNHLDRTQILFYLDAYEEEKHQQEVRMNMHVEDVSIVYIA